ncbi:MAG TPA: 2-dehydro-3-deoxy-D-gluconate 5-dehydrogenase KduD [Polyangiaceae bacterium]|nr:2-dehydro-3-deoxy-D-gluconate 5-dehydrogenase KduD [Polyangiaceae bacterium]
MSQDPFRLDGKVALVTGSASGIGATIAIALAKAGADVVCHGRSDSGRATVEEIVGLGRRSFGIQADLADRVTHAELIAEPIKRFGRLDVLVNNAGLIRRAPAVEYSDEDWDELLAVNLSAAFRLSREAGKHMLERGSGSIINIASLLSFQGGIRVPAYAASKGGVAQLTKALANEWAPRGVTVNAIAPGYIATKNTDALRADPERSRQILERIPAGRWGEPSDIAGATLFLASDASRYVNGHVLVVDGGWMGR